MSTGDRSDHFDIAPMTESKQTRLYKKSTTEEKDKDNGHRTASTKNGSKAGVNKRAYKSVSKTQR